MNQKQIELLRRAEKELDGEKLLKIISEVLREPFTISSYEACSERVCNAREG
jgi:hypothetical protein